MRKKDQIKHNALIIHKNGGKEMPNAKKTLKTK